MTTKIGKGSEAKDWLESQGLVAKTPAIRSSDYESILSCPFQYYLSRRLGLVPALRWSAALSRGSWFHRRLELFQEPKATALNTMEGWLDERVEELKEICEVRGIIGEAKQRVFDREKKDMLMALSWFEAMQEFQVPSKGSVVDYLSKPWFRILGKEVTAEYNHPEYGRLLAQYDILLYHEKQKSLFIVDAKTCSGSTICRLQTCPIEFQTKHYLHILNYLLSSGKLSEAYDLPPDTKVGGMIHIAVQKPTIEFGMNDRDFEEKEHTLSRGPRKGQIELRKTYSGEPRWENYRDRCKRWFLAKGEYEDKKPERNSDPPVNFSLTYASSSLDWEGTCDYHGCLGVIHKYSSCDPIPGIFPMSANHLRQFGKLSPYSPFYLTRVSDWPTLLSMEGFAQHDRDSVEADISG
jgi:hypothetical protein